MNRIQCTINNAQLTITVAIIIILLAACQQDEAPEAPTGTPITIGKITVAGDGEGSTRTVGPWTAQYEAFNDGDKMEVENISKVGNLTTTYRFQAPGTWVSDPQSGDVVFYKGVNADEGEWFSATKGNPGLITDQGTFADYCKADLIYGILSLSGHELVNKNGNPLKHQHVDVVIHITPVSTGGHWDGVDFMALMGDKENTKVRFLDNTSPTPREITPFLATLTPQMATYRAVIPVDALPIATNVDAKPIITITSKSAAPVTGKYTLDVAGNFTAYNAYGKRLTINLKYENKRSLTGTATVSSWTTGPTYEVEHNGYMVINSAESLKAFRDLVNAGNTGLKAIQTGDIDLKGEPWKPIGIYDSTPFAGTYNGGGYTISGLNVDGGSNNYQGLFGYTGTNAILTGINLIKPTVTGGYYVGALVGWADGSPHINNCSVQGGTITGTDTVGGLVGYNSNGIIVACYATDVDVTADTGPAGGLVGNNLSTIAFCYATAKSVTGSVNNTGALVGYNSNNSTIYSCYAIPTAAGQDLVGSGSFTIPPVANCNSTSDTDAGNTVRAYSGNPITIETGFNTSRTVDASIWERDEKEPGLIWK